MSPERNHLQSQEDENKIAEMRMKIGDIIVKVTKKLGNAPLIIAYYRSIVDMAKLLTFFNSNYFIRVTD